MTPIKRILIFYLSIGTGHRSAANSLKEAIQNLDGSCKVNCEDLFTPEIGKSIIPEFLSINASVFFSNIYDKAWHSGSMQKAYEIIVQTPMLRSRIMELVSRYQPDALVCTHSLPASILANLRLEGYPLPNILTVSTDYLVHPYWPVKGIDGFVVANVDGARLLSNRGVNSILIRDFGIPVNPLVEVLVQKKELVANLRPNINPLNLLVLAGGKRLAPYVSVWPKTIKLIRKSEILGEKKVHWNVICGKSSVFEKALGDIVKQRKDVTLYNFVSEFLFLLSTQDFVLSKPGGLILAESSALGIPVILLSRGSGQESANSNKFLSSGAGYLAETEEEAYHLLSGFITEPTKYAEAKKAALSMGKPLAARQTAEWLLRGLT